MAIRVNVRQQGLEASIRKATQNVNRRGLSVRLNEKSFTRPLGKITGSVSEFNKSLEASNARVLAFGASVGIIQGVQRAFAGLVKATVQVEKALAEVNVVMGVTEIQLEKFGQGLFTVARNTAQSFSTVAIAATELARQGLSMEETLKRTNDALILTRLTGMGAEQAVSGLTAAINTFNKAGLSSTQIISKMAAVDVQFAVSTEDLVDGIARAGAVAQDAGVSFDQLLGAVTAAQQQTARGGKVIGNSFKTIFTRIQRQTTIKRLEELGIAVRDVAGNTLPAIAVLSNLAKTYDNLTDTTKAAVAEQVGGVFQINILKAAIKDLANENSVLARATRTAAEATDEAYRKNEMLNKTLAALTAQTAASIQELAAAIGKVGLEDSLKRWVSVIKDFADVLNRGLGDGEETGYNWGKGIIKGLGNVLTGPVMLAAFAVLGSLLKKTAGFLFNSVREMIGITSQAEKHRKIQASIVALLAENGALQTKLLSLEGNRAGQERIILSVLQAQNREKARMAAMAAGIAPAIHRGGFGSNLQRRGGRSQGHIPNYASTKDRGIEKAGARAGGYAPGAVKEMNMPGQGRVVYNSAETIKYFGGMIQPAIMPPRRSSAGKNYNKAFKRTHGFDPYASMGHVPNFARSPYMAQSVGYKPKYRGSKISKEMDMGQYIKSLLRNPGASGVHTNIQPPPSMGRRNREGEFIKGKTLPFWGGPQSTWQEMWKGYKRFGLKQDPMKILRPVFGKSKGGGTRVSDLPKDMQETALQVMRAQAEMSGRLPNMINKGTVMSGRAEAVLQKMFLMNKQSIGQKQSMPGFPASSGLIPNFAMGAFRPRALSSSPYVQARAGLKNDIQEKAVKQLHHFIARRDNTGRGASDVGGLINLRGRPATKDLFNDLDMYQAAVVTKGGKIHVGHGHDEIRDMLFRQKVSLADARDLTLDWTTVGQAREAQRAVATQRRGASDAVKLDRELKRGKGGLTAAEMREIAMGGTVTPRRPSSGGHIPNYARGRFSKFLHKSNDFIKENAWPAVGIGAAWNILPPMPAAMATSSIMAMHALASGAKTDAALRGRMALEKLIGQGRSGNTGRGRGATRIKHLPEIWQKEALRGGGAHRTMGSMVPRDIMKRLGMSGGSIPNFARYTGKKTPQQALAAAQRTGLGTQARIRSGDHTRTIGMSELDAIIRDGKFKSIKYNPLDPNLPQETILSAARSGVHAYKKGKGPPRNTKTYEVDIPQLGIKVGPGQHYPSWNAFDLATGSRVIHSSTSGAGSKGYRRLQLDRIDSIVAGKEHLKVDPKMAAMGMIPNYALWQHEKNLGKNLQANLGGLDLSTQAGQLKSLKYMDGAGLQRLLNTWQGSISKTGAFDGWRGSYPSMSIKDRGSLLGGSHSGGIYDKGSPLASSKTMNRIFNSPGAAKEFFAYLTGAKNGMDIGKFLSPQEKDYFKQKYGSVPVLKHIEDMGANGTKASRLSVLREDFFNDPKVKASLPRNIAAIQTNDKRQQAIIGENRKLSPLLKTIEAANASRKFKNIPNVLMAGYDAEMKGTPRGGMPPISRAQAAAITAAMAQGGVVGPRTRPYSADYGLHKRNDAREKFLRETNIRERLARAGHNINIGATSGFQLGASNIQGAYPGRRVSGFLDTTPEAHEKRLDRRNEMQGERHAAQWMKNIQKDAKGAGRRIQRGRRGPMLRGKRVKPKKEDPLRMLTQSLLQRPGLNLGPYSAGPRQVKGLPSLRDLLTMPNRNPLRMLTQDLLKRPSLDMGPYSMSKWRDWRKDPFMSDPRNPRGPHSRYGSYLRGGEGYRSGGHVPNYANLRGLIADRNFKSRMGRDMKLEGRGSNYRPSSKAMDLQLIRSNPLVAKLINGVRGGKISLDQARLMIAKADVNPLSGGKGGLLAEFDRLTIGKNSGNFQNQMKLVGSSGGHVPNYGLFGPGVKNVIKASPSSIGAIVDSVKRESSFGLTPKVVTAPGLKSSTNPGLAVVNQEQEGGRLSGARRLHGSLNPKQGASGGHVPNFVNPYTALAMERGQTILRANLARLASSVAATTSVFQPFPQAITAAQQAFQRLQASAAQTARNAREGMIRHREETGRAPMGKDRAYARQLFREDRAGQLASSSKYGTLVRGMVGSGGGFDESEFQKQRTLARTVARQTGDSSTLTALNNLNRNLNRYADQKFAPQQTARHDIKKQGLGLHKYLKDQARIDKQRQVVMGQAAKSTAIDPRGFDQKMAQRLMVKEFLKSQGVRTKGMNTPAMMALAGATPTTQQAFQKYMGSQGVVHQNAAMARAGFMQGDFGKGAGQIQLGPKGDVMAQRVAMGKFTKAMSSYQKALATGDKKGEKTQHRLLQKLAAKDSQSTKDQARLMQGIAAAGDSTKDLAKQRKTEAMRRLNLRRSRTAMGEGRSGAAAWHAGKAGEKAGTGFRERAMNLAAQKMPYAKGSRPLGMMKPGSMMGMGLSFILPMLGGMLESQIKRTDRARFNKETGRYDVEDANTNPLLHSERTSSTLMGAGMGAIFGLPGLIAGAAIGWVAGTKKMTLSLDEMAQMTDEGNKKLAMSLQSGEKIQGLLVSRSQMAAKGDTGGMRKMNSQINAVLSQISDKNVMRKLSRSAGSMEGFNNAIATMQDQLARGNAVGNFISASKSGNVGNAGNAIATMISNSMDVGSKAQVARIEKAFDNVDRQMKDLKDRSAVFTAEYLGGLRDRSAGGFGNMVSAEGASWALIGGLIAAGILAGFSAPFTGGGSLVTYGVIASAALGGAAYGGEMHREKKQDQLKNFRNANAATYDFLEEFYQVGAITEKEYERMRAAFERGSLSSLQLLEEIEQSIESMDKMKDNGKILGDKIFKLNKAFADAGRELEFEIKSGKMITDSDFQTRSKAYSFSDQFASGSLRENAQHSGQRQLTNLFIKEQGELKQFGNQERATLLKFTQEKLSKMNIPIAAQTAMIQKLGPGGEGVAEVQDMVNKQEMRLDYQLVDKHQGSDSIKSTYKAISKILEAGLASGGKGKNDLGDVHDEMKMLLGDTSIQAYEAFEKMWFGQSRTQQTGNVSQMFPQYSANVGATGRQGMFLKARADKLNVAHNLNTGGGVTPTQKADAYWRYNENIDSGMTVSYSKELDKEAAQAIQGQLDTMLKARQLMNLSLKVRRRGLKLEILQNQIQAGLNEDMMQMKNRRKRGLWNQEFSLMDKKKDFAMAGDRANTLRNSSLFGFADAGEEMDRQTKIEEGLQKKQMELNKSQAILQAKQGLDRILSEKALVFSLDSLAGKVDDLMIPLTAGIGGDTFFAKGGYGGGFGLPHQAPSSGGVTPSNQGTYDWTDPSTFGMNTLRYDSSTGSFVPNNLSPTSIMPQGPLIGSGQGQGNVVTILGTDPGGLAYNREGIIKTGAIPVGGVPNQYPSQTGPHTGGYRQNATNQRGYIPIQGGQGYGAWQFSPRSSSEAAQTLFNKGFGTEAAMLDTYQYDTADQLAIDKARSKVETWKAKTFEKTATKRGLTIEQDRILGHKEQMEDTAQSAFARALLHDPKPGSSPSSGKYKTWVQSLKDRVKKQGVEGGFESWGSLIESEMGNTKGESVWESGALQTPKQHALDLFYETVKNDEKITDVKINALMGQEKLAKGALLSPIFAPRQFTKEEFTTASGVEFDEKEFDKANNAIINERRDQIRHLHNALRALYQAELDAVGGNMQQGTIVNQVAIGKAKKELLRSRKALGLAHTDLANAISSAQKKIVPTTSAETMGKIMKGLDNLKPIETENFFKEIIDVDSLDEIVSRVEARAHGAAPGSEAETIYKDYLIALEKLRKQLSMEEEVSKAKIHLRKLSDAIAKDDFLRLAKPVLDQLSRLKDDTGVGGIPELRSYYPKAQAQMQLSDITGNQLLNPTARAQAKIGSLLGGVRYKGTEEPLNAEQIKNLNVKLGLLFKEKQINRSALSAEGLDDSKKSEINERIAIAQAKIVELMEKLERTTPRDGSVISEIRTNLGAGVKSGMAAIQEEAEQIYITLGQNLPMAFRDGMVNAMTIALEKAEDMSDKFRAIGIGFLQMIQQAVLKSAASRVMGLFGFAEGGPVYGGSGTRDDVPAMLMGGEYVMRKSSVEKYGPSFMENLNAGSYAEGGPVRKQGGGFNLKINRPRARERKEHENESKFGDITTYDVVKKERPISKHLSPWARENDPSVLKFFDDNQRMFEEDKATEEQRKDRKKAEGEYETQKRKAYQAALLGIVAGVAAGYLAKKMTKKARSWGAEKRLKRKIDRDGKFTTEGSDLRQSGMSLKDRDTYRTMVRRGARQDASLGRQFLNDGATYRKRTSTGEWKTYETGPIQGTIYGGGDGGYDVELNRGGQVPAMLTGGEYVIGRESVQKYGPQVMSSINEGHFSGFNQGGQVGAAGSSTTNDNTKNDVNITVNVTGGGVVSESVDSSGAGAVGDPKEFGKKIKAAVLDVIQQQKRVGGILR